MAQQRIDILFPEGRLVMGSAYKPRDKDAEGKPLLIKNGPDAGKPRVDYFVGVAIPKIPGHAHWANTDWGQKILQAGAAAFPQLYQSPKFAWKIEDGDSQVPNGKGRKPCDNEGWKGCWVVKFSGGYAPKIFQQPTPGTFVEVTTPDALKAGYWVQVSGNVSGNGSAQQPGVYLNHSALLFTRADTEISQGLDAATAFAGAAVSQGSLGGAAPAFAAPVLPGTVGVGMPGLPAPGAAVLPAMAAPVAQVAVAPQPAFLAVPGGIPAVPGAAAPAAVAPALQMPPALPVPAMPAAPAGPVTPTPTSKLVATGYTYQQMRDAGWTDAALRAEQYIV